ncbi:MAG: diguanylate cyclase [Bacillus subtilis]|nr:diguanylate cyclase [Bacillus subtilis]
MPKPVNPLHIPWQFYIKKLREESNKIVDETTRINVQRFRLMSFFTIPVLIVVILSIAFRDYSTPDELRWRTGIPIFDSLAIFMYLFVNVAMTLTKKDPGGIVAQIIQGCAGFLLLFINVMITVVGQLVAPNLTVITFGIILYAMVALFRPTVALIVFGANYLLFFFLIAITQTDPNVLFSHRVNGFILFLIGWFLSYLFWITKIQQRNQLMLIEQQRQELETVNKSLFELATTDQLTGLYNRRHLEEKLVTTYQHLTLGEKQIAILLIDIDNFKFVNDRFGHPAGDQLLRDVAALLKERQTDNVLLSRWGGDEFLVAMLQSTKEQAIQIATIIKTNIEKIQLGTLDAPLVVSASIGVVIVESDFATAYKAVDRSLYRAKLQGKNQVVADSIEPLIA